jgi:hypothetical protein
MKVIGTPLKSDNVNAVLFDTSNSNSLVIPRLAHHKDEGYRQDIIGGWSHRPYGITWDADNIFIACRRNMIVYDNQLQEVEMLEGILGDNTHQISYWNGSIISVQTTKECLGFYDLATGESKLLHIRDGWVEDSDTLYKEDRVFRMNDILVKGDYLYVLANSSEAGNEGMLLLKINPSSGAIVESLEVGTGDKCHGIYSLSAGFFTLGVNGSIGATEDAINLPIIEKPASFIAKGMCGDELSFCFGMSDNLLEGSGCYLQEYSDFLNNEPPRSVWVEGLVMPQGLRRIDGADKCHLNPFPFPYAGF